MSNLLITILIALASFFGYHSPAPSGQLFGSTFTPVGGQTYTLSGAGVTATASTIQLNSFTTPDGRAISMTMFGSTGYGVLEPNTTSKIEDVTFTGVTQNANGTATLTGVTRGNDFVSPYAASTTLSKAHAGGTYFVLSNTAGFYGQQFAFTNNPTTIAAVWTFGSTTQPAYDGTPAVWSSPFSLVDKQYVDSGILNGAATSTFANQGLVQLANRTQDQAGTASSTNGSPLVLPSLFASSTPYSLTPAGTIPVTAAVGGKLSQLWLDLTANFTVSGTWNFTSNVGVSTSTPYAPLSVVGSGGVVADKFNATSTLPTATSSLPYLRVSNNATTTNLWVSGTCTNCADNGYEQDTNTTAGPTSGNTTASITAACSGVKKVISGGAGTSGSWQAVYVSAPSGTTGWTATVMCQNGGGCTAGTVTATAICVNP